MSALDVLHPEQFLPVAGDAVKCGNRPGLRAALGIPRNAPLHDWMDLGPDVRNLGDAGFQEVNIKACRRCGADKHEAIR